MAHRGRRGSGGGDAQVVAEARRALAALAAGDFSRRLAGPGLDPALCEAFNRLAATLAFLEQADGQIDGPAAPADSAAAAAAFWPGAPGDDERLAHVAVVAMDAYRSAILDLDLRTRPEAVEVLCERIRAHLDGALIGRVSASTIEIRFLSRPDEDTEARLLALAAALEAPLPVKGGVALFKVTIGYAAWPWQNSRVSRVMANAEHALAKARAAHLKLATFTDQDRSEAEARWNLASDLVKAVAGDEISLRYQPKLNLRSGRIESVEALARWLHPERGFVPPDEFIGLAERTGLIEGVTRFTLERAVAEQAALQAAGHAVAVNVNISGQLVSDAPFVDWAIATALAAPGRIGFEITETAVIGDPEHGLKHLRKIADAGIAIAIDDYGVGLSSLTYLKQFPARELKIDKAFIGGLAASHSDPLIVRSTIDLAHALGMEITAEGVEDQMTLALLQVMGCDQIQGYHLSKPLTLAELSAFLDRFERQPKPLPAKSTFARPA